MSNEDYFGEKVMSNDNAIVRCFKLWAKIAMMVVDGTRDATSVADVLQDILTKFSFNPATFIGEDWSYAEARDPRSAAISFSSKVKLSTSWIQDKLSVTGEIRRQRLLDFYSVVLNCDHFFYLWKNKEKIPEAWKTAGYITFDGDILRNSSGHRHVLYLYWGGSGWSWSYRWLDLEFDTNYPSAVRAS